MVELFCALVGEARNVFCVTIDASKSVGHLKAAIKTKNKLKSIDASRLKLFLAKKGEAWLTQKQVDEGIYGTSDFKRLKVVAAPLYLVGLSEKDVTFEVTMGDVETKSTPVHVLARADYQRRGRIIQDKCQDYCAHILDKVDEFYDGNERPLPFICVEGSSGMGKSQLAFALGGRRPYYYWPAISIRMCFQTIYRNFISISNAFVMVFESDAPEKKCTERVLNCQSSIYRNDLLWTYGFICALLKHCSSAEHQIARQMIRFEDATILDVKPCDLKTVLALINKIKAEKNVLPFFVLDEMIPTETKGINTTAFQRIVFRACGLVVIVMGTDSKVTNLLDQVKGSDGVRYKWMVLVPVFPSYQIVLDNSEDQQTWLTLVAKYPVVQDIVTHSRGRFSRYFMERVVKYVVETSEVELCRLFLHSKNGQYAQLMAISHSNAVVCGENEEEPPIKKTRLEVEAIGMHSHFANLIDDEVKDVFSWNGELTTNAGLWEPKCCFPPVNKDVLLYLAILGGKIFPSYFDLGEKHFSTKCIFATTEVFSVHENSNAVSDDYKSFENLVAHAIFTSSRRNGVQGIPFNDFFEGLLGEFQEELWKEVKMHCRNTKRSMSASDIFDGYVEDVTNVSKRTIPFLAPPNAKWPPFIIDNTRNGCRFGHLIRACNAERCDVYIQDVEIEHKKTIFLCECKYWNKNVDISAMRAIINGLDQKWHWEVVLLFCMKLASDCKEWENPDIGCVKVNSQDGEVDWIFQPNRNNRIRLLVVVETLNN
ncbi:hypothetical protein Plhal703r1_c30g0117771 [Plasmopara halstedii]